MFPLNRGKFKQQSTEDIAKQKDEAIALGYRRIDAAVNLYKDGEIDRDEYLRVRALNEREIAHWQSRTTETEQLGIELALCIEAVERIVRLWDASNDEDRQGLARSLFTSIVYNLDIRRIVSFKLKPWAERFLVLRATLYANENTRSGKTNKPQPEGQGLCTELPHRGKEPYPRYFARQFRVRRAKTEVRIRIESPEKAKLRERVRELRAHGLSYPAVARALGISEGTAWNYANHK